MVASSSNGILTDPMSKVVKTSVSMEPELLEIAQVIAKQSGYRYSFSAWVSDVIRKEIECHAAPIRLMQTSQDQRRSP